MDTQDIRRVIILLRGDLRKEVEAFMARENRKPANAVETLVARGLEYERQQPVEPRPEATA